jgi:hypothetical protein
VAGHRFVPLIALLGSALLGLAPLQAGPGASADIDDLDTAYDGRSHSSDGSNEGADISLNVTGKDGDTFEGTFTYSNVSSKGVGGAGLGAVPLTGKVTPKGKLTAKGNIGDDKFTLKGTLSDPGDRQLIIAEYVRKDGKTVVFKALWWLEQD